MQSTVLDTPPLPDELVAVWHDVLGSWKSGPRKKAIGSAETLVAQLSQGEPDQEARFGRWLCERLFDDSFGWKGQWGGNAGYEHAPDYALSIFPLTTGVVIPHLGRELQKPTGQALRWLYQATVGMGGRLTPEARDRLDEMLKGVCGQGAGRLELLRLAAADDERARRWLADIESDDHPCGPLWIPRA
jgi:hypothetical protein